MNRWMCARNQGCIIIEPVRRKEYDLDELLKKITRKNVHQEVEFGRPLGKRHGTSKSYVPDAGDIVWLSFDPRWDTSKQGTDPRLY